MKNASTGRELLLMAAIMKLLLILVNTSSLPETNEWCKIKWKLPSVQAGIGVIGDMVYIFSKKILYYSELALGLFLWVGGPLNLKKTPYLVHYTVKLPSWVFHLKWIFQKIGGISSPL